MSDELGGGRLVVFQFSSKSGVIKGIINNDIDQVVDLLGVEFDLGDVDIGFLRVPDVAGFPMWKLHCLVKTIAKHLMEGEVIGIIPGKFTNVLSTLVVKYFGPVETAQEFTKAMAQNLSPKQIKIVDEYQPNSGIFRDNDSVFFYSGAAKEPYGWMSNFSSYTVTFRRKTYPSSEHLFQALKFEGTDDSWAEKIRLAKTAMWAAKMGRSRKHPIKENWDDIKDKAMYFILELKLKQHPDLQTKLLETEGKRLVEDSPKDSYWGVGSTGDGRNQLGKTWMYLRRDWSLKNSQTDWS